jgi:hypothetical protein
MRLKGCRWRLRYPQPVSRASNATGKTAGAVLAIGYCCWRLVLWSATFTGCRWLRAWLASWPVVAAVIVGLTLGTDVGARIAAKVSQAALHRLLVGTVLLMTAYMAWTAAP